MSKTTNVQKVECLKSYLEDFRRSRKYQPSKITLEDMADIKTKYAYKDSK